MVMSLTENLILRLTDPDIFGQSEAVRTDITPKFTYNPFHTNKYSIHIYHNRINYNVLELQLDLKLW